LTKPTTLQNYPGGLLLLALFTIPSVDRKAAPL